MIFRKTNTLSWKLLLLTVVFLGTLSACGGGSTPVPEPEVTTGQVALTPSWGSLPVPTSVRFFFYPASGTAISKDCDATGFKGELEAGTYRALAYNTDAENVTFENTGSYATAAARVKSAGTSTRGSSFLNVPGNVYTLAMENLSVTKGGAVSQQLIPRNLVKTLQLNLTVDNASTVNALGGSLNGLYPSVLLATGAPTAAATEAAAAISALFDLSLSGTSATADLKTLGIRNPENGSAYACLLTLYVEGKDGSELTSEVDLSEEITQILVANGGTLPEGTPARIDLRVTVAETPSGLTVSVCITDWDAGQDSGVIL